MPLKYFFSMETIKRFLKSMDKIMDFGHLKNFFLDQPKSSDDLLFDTNGLLCSKS